MLGVERGERRWRIRKSHLVTRLALKRGAVGAGPGRGGRRDDLAERRGVEEDGFQR